MDIKEAGLIKGRIADHWYYRAKLAALYRLVSDLRPTSILDVGAGVGFFSYSLLAATSAGAALCVDSAYVEERDETQSGKHLHFRRSIERSDADLVLLMDVIEHVADDAALLREYVAKVRSGTRFIISAPAFMALWSGHDVFLEHVRRYTLSGVENVVRASGLTVELGCYFYAPLLPLAAVSRGLDRLRRRDRVPARSQMREFSPVLNTALWSVCRAELPVFKANRLAGLTVFVRAVK